MKHTFEVLSSQSKPFSQHVSDKNNMPQVEMCWYTIFAIYLGYTVSILPTISIIVVFRGLCDHVAALLRFIGSFIVFSHREGALYWLIRGRITAAKRTGLLSDSFSSAAVC